jgi:c(7)-type cytochrome triheme protein
MGTRTTRSVLGAALLAGVFAAVSAAAADAPGQDSGKAKAAAPAAAEAAGGEGAEAPETIKMDKVGKLQPVVFGHAAHGKLNACADCHEGKEPLFPKKRGSEGMKMSDMKAGKGCGSCHDGKKTFGQDKKKIFASTMCMKCHKPASAK